MKRSLWTLLLLATLAGCEATLPEKSPAMAWVDVSRRAGYSLTAKRLDGKLLSDGRYFQLQPGRHLLELRLGYERHGSGTGSQWRHCRIEIDYSDFVAGQQYSLYAVAMGHSVRVWLRNADGKRLQESRAARCEV